MRDRDAGTVRSMSSGMGESLSVWWLDWFVGDGGGDVGYASLENGLLVMLSGVAGWDVVNSGMVENADA